MIDNWFEFELNGVKYKGKSVGGDPPIRESGQALRAQNAQLVQGEANAVFNMRPDVLVFSWTDWSGGEGQHTFDPQAPDRYWEGLSINAFARPGTLRAGPAVEMTLDSTGLAEFEFTHASLHESGSMAMLDDDLVFGVNDDVYVWNPTTERWGTATAVTGSAGVIRDMVSDGVKVYMSDGNEVQTWDGTTFVTLGSDATASYATVVQFGDYVYHIALDDSDTDGVRVREYQKSAATPPDASTIVYDEPGNWYVHGSLAGALQKRLVTEGPNKFYLVTTVANKSWVHEITPTTDAAAASGAPIAMLPVQALSTAWSGGLLFVHASVIGADTNPEEGCGVLMYVNPSDGTYGVVDKVRPSRFFKNTALNGSMQRDAVGLSENYMGLMVGDALGGNYRAEVVVHDTTKGALHSFARAVAGPASGVNEIIKFRGEIFFAIGHDPGVFTGRVARLLKDAYEGDNLDPYAISSVWDFGLVDEKILSSIRLSCETIPTDWTVRVQYMLDESGTWVTAGTAAEATDGGTFTISTDSSTAKFRQLRLKILLLWGGSGHPATTPVVLGVEARAQVSQKLRSWTAILDCSDDQGQAQNQSLKGHQKIDNIQTAGTPNGNVVLFKNGFSHRQPNQYDEYDVIVDDYEIFYQRPGEGYAVVRLIEVA